jgi:hypothetical protein
MMKAPHNVGAEPAWESVSSKMPCPICGGESDCRLHAEELFVHCTKVLSEWPLTTGGWLHRSEPVTGTTRSLATLRAAAAAYDGASSREALARRASRLYVVRGQGR